MKRLRHICCIIAEFNLPVPYSATPADAVNELLFELLTRQLSQLGHREVLLQDHDCSQLLHYLGLHAASSATADRPAREQDEDTNGNTF